MNIDLPVTAGLILDAEVLMSKLDNVSSSSVYNKAKGVVNSNAIATINKDS